VKCGMVRKGATNSSRWMRKAFLNNWKVAERQQGAEAHSRQEKCHGLDMVHARGLPIVRLNPHCEVVREWKLTPTVVFRPLGVNLEW
jgi:hypothetical protein